ncbi:uncharacterized protein LOC9635356 isoform X1 [Selaginella moellendorffii]|uniref:uncharacterized protein LOC9635356 isoform X1 n=1 Tax=Selaginella moellendorffii TaxID=88036 RepID=UPI000D1C38DA|nr:uncharacterized protein LOC9635356 isoform X1 [Selaginella moellendorffii]|eukprot:XP_024527936.1 uncharacterized protein LOC9635356 isoform X1 [Selaginella moellendorffii]
MQPEQLLDDAYYAVKELGEKRSRGSYNLCSLLRSVVALGSDWPVVAVNPLGVVRAAVERTPAGWSHPWIPEERIYSLPTLWCCQSLLLHRARAIFLEWLLRSLVEILPSFQGVMPNSVNYFVNYICEKMGEEKAARIIKQLVKTLKEMHLRGVVH